MKKGMLIRVAVDSSYGGWNAPVNPVNGDFVFIPIPENEKYNFKENQNIPYNTFSKALKDFSSRNNLNDGSEIALPDSLLNINTHLDPDFSYLTYGDNGMRRGKKLKHEFESGDFIVFYSGLKPIQHFKSPLFYAIIGFYQIDKVIEAKDVNDKDSIINAHTRRKNLEPSDVVIIANPKNSGRLENSILIGEFRDKAYRIKNELLESWGGLSVKDGYLQRSAVPPRFNDPQKFLEWFEKQNVNLIKRNN